MELSTWNVKEYRIADPQGNEAVILYRPVTQGWRARHLESALHSKKAFSDVGGAASLLEAEEPLTDEQIETVIRVQKGALDALSSFQRSLLEALVVGSRDLTIEGEEPSPQELVDLMIKLEDPATELMNHILEEGRVDDEAGKD